MQEDLEYEQKTGRKRVSRDTGEMLQRAEYADTTLLIHFFGRKGQGELTFEQFKRQVTSGSLKLKPLKRVTLLFILNTDVRT